MLPHEKFKFKSSQMATQWLSATRTLVRLSEGAKVAFLIVFKSPPPPPSQPHPLHEREVSLPLLTPFFCCSLRLPPKNYLILRL